MSLVDVGITVRSAQSNPWLDRLLASLNTTAAGVPYRLMVEEGEHFTRTEKRMRLLRRSDAPYLCVMEDDTECVQPGWLLTLVCTLTTLQGFATVSPQETRALVPEAGLVADGHVAEALMTPGFCYVLNRAADLGWDHRISTMDDLYLSLLARSRGWRLGVVGGAVVRHTKEPWLRDDLPPHMQPDRSRFGVGADYYDPERHERKRLAEAKYLVEVFGSVAWSTIPRELRDALQYFGGSGCEMVQDGAHAAVS
jgi:hypothetical protein